MSRNFWGHNIAIPRYSAQDFLDGKAIAINCTGTEMGLEGAFGSPDTSPPASFSDFITQSLSASSKRAYQADMRHFTGWGGTLPSTPEQVAS